MFLYIGHEPIQIFLTLLAFTVLQYLKSNSTESQTVLKVKQLY